MERKPIGGVGDNCNEDIDCAINLNCIKGTCQTKQGSSLTVGQKAKAIFLSGQAPMPTWGKKNKKKRTKRKGEKKKKKSKRIKNKKKN